MYANHLAFVGDKIADVFLHPFDGFGVVLGYGFQQLIVIIVVFQKFDFFSTWLGMGKDFDVYNVRDALSAFSRLISPTHKRVFEKIFNTLETGLSKLGDSSGTQTKAISVSPLRVTMLSGLMPRITRFIRVRL